MYYDLATVGGAVFHQKKTIHLVESSGEDKPSSQSDIQQSGGTGVNQGLSVTDTSIGVSEFSNDDGSEMMQNKSNRQSEGRV